MNAFSYLDTPLGCLEIIANQEALTRVAFVEGSNVGKQSNDITNAAKAQLGEYFRGKRQRFELPLAPEGTAFQQRVWQTLMSIGFGQTASYHDVAHLIDNPNAVRAVGAANGKNPIAIIIPCHRIIGKNGTLTGYAGGLTRKQWLLNLESA